mmetsp:Transcript_16731/g.31702  ORF Transcript_16731/g.31702 Transcript_16731/m.31702 type:complete len:141 (-) Transcript_16731:112-534(-)
MTMTRPDINAKQMFFVGLLGLPWLWVVNVLYHWKAVYGSAIQNDSNSSASDDNGRGGTSDENTGILDLMNSNEGENENTDTVPPEIIQLELSKWVKRSTLGSILSFTIFISWIITFQVNKDSFSSKWFVMSPDEELVTGW